MAVTKPSWQLLTVKCLLIFHRRFVRYSKDALQNGRNQRWLHSVCLLIKGGHGIEGEQGCTGALPRLLVRSQIAVSFSRYYLSAFVCNAGYQLHFSSAYRSNEFSDFKTQQRLLKSCRSVSYCKSMVGHGEGTVF